MKGTLYLGKTQNIELYDELYEYLFIKIYCNASVWNSSTLCRTWITRAWEEEGKTTTLALHQPNLWDKVNLRRLLVALNGINSKILHKIEIRMKTTVFLDDILMKEEMQFSWIPKRRKKHYNKISKSTS